MENAQSLYYLNFYYLEIPIILFGSICVAFYSYSFQCVQLRIDIHYEF